MNAPLKTAAHASSVEAGQAPAIRVRGIGKCYRLFDRPLDRMLQLLAGSRRRYYRDHWALRGVSLDVARGECVGLVGRNGSGKSTLLQIICDTLSPSEGELTVNGRVAAILELGSGFNPEFTGRENVMLNGAILGLSSDYLRERLDFILDFADIGDAVDQPVRTYSSGMLVRLAFAVQASIDPDILVIDEALAVGDERFQRKCFARLDQLRRAGTAILFVSHAGQQVVELCDRAALLDDGELLAVGNPAGIVRTYQRLLYAPADHQEEFRQLVRQHGTNAVILARQAEALAGPPPRARERAAAEAYDPSLVPSTTVDYPALGARIDAFVVRNADGQQVNILELGREYRFEIRGNAERELHGIHFGLHLRNVSGAVVAGQRHPAEGRELLELPASASFVVTFRFRVTLLPGAYFVGGGIWTTSDEGCVHRQLDAIMVRVQAVAGSGAFGYVDLSEAPPSLEFPVAE